MNEDVFRQLLGEMLESEFAEYDNPPKWKFSLKHRIAMKRIFARYERNVQKLKEKTSETSSLIEHNKPRLNIKQRLLIALCIIVLMTFLVGWVIVFISRDFHGTVYEDNTFINAVNLENSPKTIEYKYALSSVPEGFEMIETDSSPTDVYTLYENSLTRQTINIHQWVKSHYKPHFNTEHHNIDEVNINNIKCLYVDFSNNEDYRTLMVWDNGDYIIEFSADLDKDSTINLLEINEFL